MAEPDDKASQLFAAESFKWGDIDHTLASLKLTDLAIEMGRKIKSAERRIRFENRLNQSNNTIASLILRMKEENTNEWARGVYRIYCQVWGIQGNAKTAAFVRAVFRHAILVTIRARTNAIKAEFLMWAKRTSFNGTLAQAQLKGLQLRMMRLQDDWFRRLEAEAKELEHAARQGVPTRASLGEESTLGTLSEGINGPHGMTDNPRLETIIRKVQNPQKYTTLMISETSEYFDVSTRTIHRWVSEKKLDFGGRRGSITIRSIRRWQAKRSRTRPSRQN